MRDREFYAILEVYEQEALLANTFFENIGFAIITPGNEDIKEELVVWLDQLTTALNACYSQYDLERETDASNLLLACCLTINLSENALERGETPILSPTVSETLRFYHLPFCYGETHEKASNDPIINLFKRLTFAC